jgi:hypothetical protein
MSDPSSDTSTQLNNDLYADDNYSSTINFNATSGIYNPSANVIKIFTNNIDALTIDENQFLTGNATGLTNLNYNAITNKPDLTIYATNTNLNNLSTTVSGHTTSINDNTSSIISINSVLNDHSGYINTLNTNINNNNTSINNINTSINNINSTSTTIFNSLSNYITTTNANALNSRFFKNNGNTHGTLTDFNNISQFGYNFILGTANGPGVNGAGNYYSWDIGLGSEYGFNYSAQFALPRDRSNPYLCVRYKNNNVYEDGIN